MFSKIITAMISPLGSDALSGWLEARAGPRTLDGVPQAPGIVVQGGGVADTAAQHASAAAMKEVVERWLGR